MTITTTSVQGQADVTPSRVPSTSAPAHSAAGSTPDDHFFKIFLGMVAISADEPAEGRRKRSQRLNVARSVPEF